jgi:hypothetical protein
VKLRRLIAITIVLLLPACLKRQAPSQKEDNYSEVVVPSDSKNNAILDAIIQQEAMLIDIPIPLYDERIVPAGYTAEGDTLSFGYKTSLTRDQIKEFFISQMERYGWQHLVSFETAEMLLQFASPNRYCTIVIKNKEHDPIGSCFFVYIKRASL